jgi:hypothetical protein
MPSITGPLDQHRRAAVTVRIAVPPTRAFSLQQAGLPIPGPFTRPALIDTGAGITCIDRQLRLLLNLTPFSKMRLVTPSSGARPPRVRLYKVDLTLLHGTGNPVFHLVQPLFVVAQVDIAPLGFSALIGRDLLALCRFVYNGQAGTFELHY